MRRDFDTGIWRIERFLKVSLRQFIDCSRVRLAKLSACLLSDRPAHDSGGSPALLERPLDPSWPEFSKCGKFLEMYVVLTVLIILLAG